MPFYEYECPRCGRFTAFARMARSREDIPCNVCGRAAQRRLSAPALRTLANGLRQAFDRSEASAHEPRTAAARPSGSRPHVHHHHGHSQAKPSRRPWMIGH